MAKTSKVKRDEKLERKMLAAFARGDDNKGRKIRCRLTRRCKVCGRPRGYFRKFQMCRICLREHAAEGMIPGLTKSSW